MLTTSRAVLRRMGRLVFVAACLTMLPHGAHARALEATQSFRYNIEDVAVDRAGAGTWTVNVVLSVTNTVTGERCDIKFARPFRIDGTDLTTDSGWNRVADSSDAGSDSVLVSLVSSTALGGGAAFPAPMRNPQAAYAGFPGYAEGASCRAGGVDD